jgi:hypothetical protein
VSYPPSTEEIEIALPFSGSLYENSSGFRSTLKIYLWWAFSPSKRNPSAHLNSLHHSLDIIHIFYKVFLDFSENSKCFYDVICLAVGTPLALPPTPWGQSGKRLEFLYQL